MIPRARPSLSWLERSAPEGAPPILDDLDVLIPCWNEQAAIARVIRDTAAACRDLARHSRIIVIDDGSDDQSGALLTRLRDETANLVVHRHARNLGFGATFAELFAPASSTAQVIATLPGDGQVPPQALRALAAGLVRADLVVGWRKLRADPLARRIQSRLYATLARIWRGVPVHDANGPKMMRRSVIEAARLDTRSCFIDAELVLSAQRAGFRIAEVVVPHQPRAGGRASGGSLRVIAATVRDLVFAPVNAASGPTSSSALLCRTPQCSSRRSPAAPG